MVRLFSALSIALALLTACPAPGGAGAAELQTVEIATAGGIRRFSVELAQTGRELDRGLMYRKSLPDGQGMLFDFGSEQRLDMWMKNTFIPLDMVFIDAGGRVINIAERTVPQSLDPVAAAAPARAVLEVNGGTAARLGIKPGDRVVFPIFGNAS